MTASKRRAGIFTIYPFPIAHTPLSARRSPYDPITSFEDEWYVLGAGVVPPLNDKGGTPKENSSRAHHILRERDNA